MQKDQKPLCLTCAVLVLTVVLLAGGSLLAAFASPFTISQYEVQVVLKADGSADLVETIRYQIHQGLSQFEYNIDYSDAGGARLSRIEVASDLSPEGTPVFFEVQPADAASNQSQPMTYEIQDNGSQLHIRLNVLSDADSRRIVRLTYQIRQGVVRHDGVALLKRSFFDSSEAAGIGQPLLTIELPQPVLATETWSLPVSLADFNTAQPSGSQFVYQAAQLAAGQDLTLIALYPLDLFPEAPEAAQLQNRDELTEAARQMDQSLHQQESWRNALTSGLILLLALSVLSIVLIYWIFDREGTALFRQRYLQKVPADYPPALLSVLMRKTKPSRLILGTLADLVRRGELTRRGFVFSQLHPERVDYVGFAAFEAFLMQWFFGRIAGGATISTAEIRKYARDPATAPDFQGDYRQFRRLIDEEINIRGLIDAGQTRRGRQTSQIIALLYLVLTVLAVFYLQKASSLFLLIPSAVLAIYSWKLRRLTVAGRELYARGEALQRTVRDFSHLCPLWDDWGDGLVGDILPLSLSLGLARQLLLPVQRADQPQLQKLAAQLAVYGISASSGPSSPDQVKALAADLQAMESMLAASLLLSSGIHW